MHALLALSAAHGLDIARRPATLILAVIGAALILSLRWFAGFGLGYEVVQIQELGVYSIGVLGALAVILFWIPGEDDTAQATELLLSRPVSPWVLAGGALLGRALIVLALGALWFGCIGLALWWFQAAEPLLFSYRGATSAGAEVLSAIGPVIGQVLAILMLLALVQPFARSGRPLVVALATVGIYLLGYTVAALGGFAGAVLPDFARHDLTAELWGTPGAGLGILHFIHACAWCALGLALDSALLSRRMRV
jgi:hypothetical protein